MRNILYWFLLASIHALYDWPAFILSLESSDSCFFLLSRLYSYLQKVHSNRCLLGHIKWEAAVDWFLIIDLASQHFGYNCELTPSSNFHQRLSWVSDTWEKELQRHFYCIFKFRICIKSNHKQKLIWIIFVLWTRSSLI